MTIFWGVHTLLPGLPRPLQKMNPAGCCAVAVVVAAAAAASGRWRRTHPPWRGAVAAIACALEKGGRPTSCCIGRESTAYIIGGGREREAVQQGGERGHFFCRTAAVYHSRGRGRERAKTRSKSTENTRQGEREEHKGVDGRRGGRGGGGHVRGVRSIVIPSGKVPHRLQRRRMDLRARWILFVSSTSIHRKGHLPLLDSCASKNVRLIIAVQSHRAEKFLVMSRTFGPATTVSSARYHYYSHLDFPLEEGATHFNPRVLKISVVRERFSSRIRCLYFENVSPVFGS